MGLPAAHGVQAHSGQTALLGTVCKPLLPQLLLDGIIQRALILVRCPFVLVALFYNFSLLRVM